MKLDAHAIRQRALSIPDCAELPSRSANALAFVIGERSRHVDRLARVTVYCDTGTVATGRYLLGSIRHVFRHNVTSLDAIERILRNPPPLTAVDIESLMSAAAASSTTTATVGGRAAFGSTASIDTHQQQQQKQHHHIRKFLDSTDSISSGGGVGLKASHHVDHIAALSHLHRHPSNSASSSPSSIVMEWMDCGLAILHAERDMLQSHWNALQHDTAAASASRNGTLGDGDDDDDAAQSANSQQQHPTAAGAYTGMEFQFSLPPDPMKHVDQCLSDITRLGRLVRAVATNGRGTVFLYGNGGVAYTPNIPRGLCQRLSELRQSSTMNSRPGYVSLGTRDRFFVSFVDGTFGLKGPKALERELKKITQPPRSVSFGPSYDTFFIVFHDGSWTFHGKDIPRALQDKLAERSNRADLVCVNLGPAGEWFVRAKNGRLWWGGVSDEMDDAIQQLQDDGHYLNFLDFGEGGSYFISYD